MKSIYNNQEQGNARITSYYSAVYGYNTKFIIAWLNIVKGIGSMFRYPAAIFLRRNMGERNYSTTITRVWILLLLILPPIYAKFDLLLMSLFRLTLYKPIYTPSLTRIESLYGYFTWYVFVAVFIYFANQRRKEIVFSKSSFDPEKFTKYSGDILEFTEGIGNRLFNEENNPRKTEIFVEPLIIVCVGFGLWILNQKIGGLLMIMAIFYHLSSWASYRIGDHALMDILDEKITKDELYGIVHKPGKLFRGGFRLYGRVPKNPEDQKTFVEGITGNPNPGFTEAT